MGRSANSFTHWVGHALEINDDRVTLPEKDLWVAVLCRAVLDACKGPPDLDMTRPANITHKNHYHYERDQARHFFMEGGSHFNLICEMAGRNPEYVQDKVRKYGPDVFGIGCMSMEYTPHFQAMTSDRPYRYALSREDALKEIILYSGSQFDPAVANALHKIMRSRQNFYGLAMDA